MEEVSADEPFTEAFGVRGAPALSPGLLALVMMLQYCEDLTDRQAAAMAVRAIDWNPRAPGCNCGRAGSRSSRTVPPDGPAGPRRRSPSRRPLRAGACDATDRARLGVQCGGDALLPCQAVCGGRTRLAETKLTMPAAGVERLLDLLMR